MRRLISMVMAGVLVAMVACTEPGAQAGSTPTATPTSTVLASVSPSAAASPSVTASSTATGVVPTAPPKAIDPTRTPVATATSGPLPIVTPTPQVTQPVTALHPMPSDRRRELAPVTDLSVRLAESSPVQVFVDLTTGLPSGCAQFDVAFLQQSGNTITLQMWNSQPSGNVACTAIYGYTRHTVPLGTLSPGTYTLQVNSETRTFTVQ